MMKGQYFLLLCIVLLIKTAIIVGFILHGKVGLGPDEAQYWTWSQSLDWGYYSKPPGIAGQIALGTHLFGNTELGVRFGSIIIGLALPLAVFFLAKACNVTPLAAFWAGIVMAVSPLGVMASFLAITDGGIVLFWTLACILAVLPAPNFYAIGALVLCGALFKWQIYYLWIFVLLFSRKKSMHLLGGMLLSLVGMIPSLLWNLKHDWATFRHVSGNIEVASEGRGNFWAFLGEQAVLLSPILFILLLISFIYLLRKSKEIPQPIYFCGMMSLIVIAAHCGIALFKKMQGNWCDYAYPSAMVFLCWYACEKISWGGIALKAGAAFSVILCLFGLSIPYLEIPYRMNPFKHNLGWQTLSKDLQEAGYDSKQDFLFSDKYQTCSILSFYGEGQKRAYFLNLHHSRNNQFSFWPSMAMEQQGGTGYFVCTENSPYLEKNFPSLIEEYQHLLKNYFKEVHFLGEFPLFHDQGRVVKAAILYKCVDYNGKEPQRATKF